MQEKRVKKGRDIAKSKCISKQPSSWIPDQHWNEHVYNGGVTTE